MPKSSLAKALEKYQKEAAKNVKKKIQADKRLADKQRRESNRPVSYTHLDVYKRQISVDVLPSGRCC